jgi:hypothetical protein
MTISTTMAFADNITGGVLPQLSLTSPQTNQERSILYGLFREGLIPTLAYSIWLGGQGISPTAM